MFSFSLVKTKLITNPRQKAARHAKSTEHSHPAQTLPTQHVLLAVVFAQTKSPDSRQCFSFQHSSGNTLAIETALKDKY